MEPAAVPISHSENDSLKKPLQVVVIGFLILSWSTLAIRVYVRRFILKSLGKDDWSMLFAQIAFNTTLVALLISIIHGFGVHNEFLEQANAEEAIRYWFIAATFYVIGTSGLKISIGFFLLRCVSSKVQRRIIWTIQAAACLFCVFYVCFYVNQCRPISLFWNLAPHPSGSCLPPKVLVGMAYGCGVANTAADVAFAIIPAMLLWKSSMNRKTKMVAWMLLSCGSLAVVGTIVRLPFTERFAGQKTDFLYTTVVFVALSVLELGLGIVAANIATFRPLMQRLFPATADSVGSKRTWSTSTGVRYDAEACWKAMSKSDQQALRSSLNQPVTLKSLTGGEELSDMPDLINNNHNGKSADVTVQVVRYDEQS